MKNALEWVKEYQAEQLEFPRKPEYVFHTGAFVRQIQRDAWKQGMIDAAAIAERFGGDINGGQGCEAHGCDTSIAENILNGIPDKKL